MNAYEYASCFQRETQGMWVIPISIVIPHPPCALLLFICTRLINILTRLLILYVQEVLSIMHSNSVCIYMDKTPWTYSHILVPEPKKNDGPAALMTCRFKLKMTQRGIVIKQVLDHGTITK